MVDSHCHLADAAFSADLAAAVARAQEAGVRRALGILAADDEEELARADGVRRLWPGVSWAAGVHPHRSAAYADDPDRAGDVARRAVTATGALAVGEIGLDYHYNPAPAEVQRAVFRAQVAVALDLGLPIVIHTRDAVADTLQVLADAGPRLRSVLHCYTGSLADARAAIELGAYVSMSGIVTFPKARELREVAALLPPDRLLLETDAPYLAPVPHRGARNEPAWVRDTYAAVAAVRGQSVETLSEQVAMNFARFLGEGEA